MPQLCLSVKPVFDYSNNMRLVLLPADTKLNSVIYRLRASDADEDYPLKFTAYGKYFGTFLSVLQLSKRTFWYKLCTHEKFLDYKCSGSSKMFYSF